MHICRFMAPSLLIERRTFAHMHTNHQWPILVPVKDTVAKIKNDAMAV